MSTQADPILFWLEQESADSKADIYMPPDTPTHDLSLRVTYQLDKKRILKRRRAIERLRGYEFEKLDFLRRARAEAADPKKLPKTHIVEAEPVDNQYFLRDHTKQIVELVKYAQEFDPAKDVQQEASNDGSDSDEEIGGDTKEEKRARAAYQKVFMDSARFHMAEVESAYDKLKTDIYNESNQPSLASSPSSRAAASPTHEYTPTMHINTSSVPPLPARVSAKDPRTFLPEYDRQVRR